MEWSPISKPRGSLPREPNLADYDAARREFTWAAGAGACSTGLPGGGLNIAHEAAVPPSATARGRPAWRSASLPRGSRPSSAPTASSPRTRAASPMCCVRLGVQRGERVASLLGRVPALYATVLGTLAAGAVYCPLFSAFGPEPVKARLALGSARVLVTTDLLYRRKVAPIRGELPELRHVLIVRTPGAGELPRGHARLRRADA